MARLEDICSINMGQSPESSSYNESGEGMPFFQGNADFGELHPKVRIWCNAPTKIAECGDVLISVRAPIGALNIADKQCCIGRGLAALTVNETVCSPKYLWYGLECKVDELNSKGTGSTFKAINKKTLAETEIPLPPLEEQRRIAVTLDKVSDLTAKRRAQLDKLDLLVNARFVEMFGDTILNPYGWDEDILGSVCDVRDGTHESPQYYDAGFPLVTSKNVTGGKIDLTDCSLICETDYNKINERSKVDIGDIIMPMIGTVGKPVIVNMEPNFAIKNVSLIKFRPNSKVLNIYILALLRSNYFDTAVLSKIRGGTQKFISLGDIRKLKILVPPIELQKEFAILVELIQKSKLTIQQSLDKLEILKKVLMQQYFG